MLPEVNKQRYILCCLKTHTWECAECPRVFVNLNCNNCTPPLKKKLSSRFTQEYISKLYSMQCTKIKMF